MLALLGIPTHHAPTEAEAEIYDHSAFLACGATFLLVSDLWDNMSVCIIVVNRIKGGGGASVPSCLIVTIETTPESASHK